MQMTSKGSTMLLALGSTFLMIFHHNFAQQEVPMSTTTSNATVQGDDIKEYLQQATLMDGDREPGKNLLAFWLIIAAIVIGFLLIVGLIVIAICFYLRRKKRKAAAEAQKTGTTYDDEGVELAIEGEDDQKQSPDQTKTTIELGDAEEEPGSGEGTTPKSEEKSPGSGEMLDSMMVSEQRQLEEEQRKREEEKTGEVEDSMMISEQRQLEEENTASQGLIEERV